MAVSDKLVERKLLLKRGFSRSKLFEIGRTLGISYFDRFISGWDLDTDEAALKIAMNVSENQLMKVFEKRGPRRWVTFRGKHYSLENGNLSLQSSWKTTKTNIYQAKKKFGKKCADILKVLVDANESINTEEIKTQLKKKINPIPVLEELERLKILVTAYEGENYREWKILEEMSPLIRLELGMAPQLPPKTMISTSASKKPERVDYIWMESQKINRMNEELDDYISSLVRHRLNSTIEFGKEFSVSYLANYLQELFGSVLYFDSLLSIVQQYGLSNIEIVHRRGKTGKRTGWSLALFGGPGTGKSFSTRDMILGKRDAKIPPHGIPGRNRYCGGITPARFIRIGQSYADLTFNFVVPEFNDWFKYGGMVEPLKLAMEQAKIKYETHREAIGPYSFKSFFSVNYNVATHGRGYSTTVQDPNFNAIEDRMLCRLHRLTKNRFIEIAQSQMRLAFGEIDIESGAQKIRDHLTLVYAIETRHPMVKDRFSYKPVMITQKNYDSIARTREAILEHIPYERVKFSARLEDRALRFACAASLLSFFQSDLDWVPVNEDALNYASKLYVEEASVRSKEEFKPEEILKKLI
jgi:hypothetical protein